MNTEPMTADAARERLASPDVTDAEAAALRSVILLHHRCTTLEAHRATAERERDDALMACDALNADRCTGMTLDDPTLRSDYREALP